MARCRGPAQVHGLGATLDADVLSRPTRTATLRNSTLPQLSAEFAVFVAEIIEQLLFARIGAPLQRDDRRRSIEHEALDELAGGCVELQRCVGRGRDASAQKQQCNDKIPDGPSGKTSDHGRTTHLWRMVVISIPERS